MTTKLNRFSGRGEYYARYRPGYPDAVIGILKQRAGWTPEARVADVGAGTGISSELFLRHGNAVSAVEPNADMRAETHALQVRYPQLRVVEGSAEQTNLPGAAFDFVIAATAFHWFDAARCRGEFRRLLRPQGRVALLWNLYQSPETPMVRAFEQLAARYGAKGRHCWGRERHNISNAAASYFGDSKRYTARYLPNIEQLDFEALLGRLLSTSYVPLPGDGRFEHLSSDLRELFDQFAQPDGLIELKYQTAMYFGEAP